MLSSIQWQERAVPFSNKMLSLALFTPECYAQLILQVWRQKLFEKGYLIPSFYQFMFSTQEHWLLNILVTWVLFSAGKLLFWIIDLLFLQWPFTDKGSNKDRAKQEDKKRVRKLYVKGGSYVEGSIPLCVPKEIFTIFHLPWFGRLDSTLKHKVVILPHPVPHLTL